MAPALLDLAKPSKMVQKYRERTLSPIGLSQEQEWLAGEGLTQGTVGRRRLALGGSSTCALVRERPGADS